jgi:hypothetical protein
MAEETSLAVLIFLKKVLAFLGKYGITKVGASE